MQPDGDLLEAWRAGDRAAGNDLFQRHFEAVHRFFVNKVGREVEDLVQRTFIRCVEGQQRFEGRSSFRTYLFAIAHNVLREHLRAKVRDMPLDVDEQSVADLGAGPATLLLAQKEQRLLLEGLRRIPIDLQVVLELYYWENLTGGELGEVLGVPEDTARSRIRRAKQLLLEVLHKIERSGELLHSTTADLEGWAAMIRGRLTPE